MLDAMKKQLAAPKPREQRKPDDLASQISDRMSQIRDAVGSDDEDSDDEEWAVS